MMAAMNPEFPSSPTQLRVGTSLTRPPSGRYAASFRFAELNLRPPLPRTRTLKGFRDHVPEDFTMSLRAPRSTMRGAAGPMRFDPDLERELGWLVNAIEAVGASFLVLPTAGDLTTGKRDRDLLREYIERLQALLAKRREDPTQAAPQAGATTRPLRIVWEPRGLWEPEDAIPFAMELDVLYAFDPLDSAVPPGEMVYARLASIGNRTRFNEGLLETVWENILEARPIHAYVMIDSPKSFREAERLRQIALRDEGTDEDSGGDDRGDDDLPDDPAGTESLDQHDARNP